MLCHSILGTQKNCFGKQIQERNEDIQNETSKSKTKETGWRKVKVKHEIWPFTHNSLDVSLDWPLDCIAIFIFCSIFFLLLQAVHSKCKKVFIYGDA